MARKVAAVHDGRDGAVADRRDSLFQSPDSAIPLRVPPFLLRKTEIFSGIRFFFC
jgi:hypothetical protein